MKTYLVMAFLLFLASCGKSGGSSSGCESMACEVEKYSLGSTAEGNIPEEALRFTTALTLVNFGTTDREKIEHAADLVKKIIMSQEFKDAIIDHTYNGKKTFVDNNGLTNLQIYERIIIAAERLTPAKNYRLDAEVELYFEESNTIGYTYPNVKRIWMNTKFFDRYTPYQVAGNLTHEWVHKLGFTHAVANTPERPYSVPYAVGYLVRQLAREMYPTLY